MANKRSAVKKLPDQGAWSHPTLLEICSALGHCAHIGRGEVLGPCPTRAWMKREQWCTNCKANDALRRLNDLLENTANHNDCRCAPCRAVKRHVLIGVIFQKRVDREEAEWNAKHPAKAAR